MVTSFLLLLRENEPEKESLATEGGVAKGRMAGEGLLTACLLSLSSFPLFSSSSPSPPPPAMANTPNLPLSPGNLGLAEQWHVVPPTLQMETEETEARKDCLKRGTGQDKVVMRRHLQFGSWLFPPYPGDNENNSRPLRTNLHLCLFLQPHGDRVLVRALVLPLRKASKQQFLDSPPGSSRRLPPAKGLV